MKLFLFFMGMVIQRESVITLNRVASGILKGIVGFNVSVFVVNIKFSL